jgi:catechol 2,3-dioxygenase-like lactoylglutathione lyase family enzyme
MITGIQQVGIGVPEAIKAKFFYRDHFGFDTKVFDDKADATLMTKYKGDKIHHRHAILAMNLAGGGGIEIWQYLSRKPVSPISAIQPGDPGIFATKIKTRNIKAAHDYFSSLGSLFLSSVYPTPENKDHFWVKDCFGNWFSIIESNKWFKKTKKHCGGVAGAIIGVSDMKKALYFYKNVLGINNEIYNVTATLEDIP